MGLPMRGMIGAVVFDSSKDPAGLRQVKRRMPIGAHRERAESNQQESQP